MRTFGEGCGYDKCAGADSWLADVRAVFETVLLVGDAYLLVDTAAARGTDRGSPTLEVTFSGPLVTLWLALVSPTDPEVSYTRRA